MLSNTFLNSNATSFTYSIEQLERLEICGIELSVDIHCHCLPGIDDGPTDMTAAVKLCRLLVEDGITSVVASPHQLGKYDLDNSRERILEQIALLREKLAEEEVPLDIVPGADIRIDERLPQLLESRLVLTTGDLESHLLLELPTQTYCEPRGLIHDLDKRDIQCIVTHPERHGYLRGNCELPLGWLRSGALIQITAGSLIGDFGRPSFEYAWQLLRLGMVTLVATDAHDCKVRPPRMTAAFAAIRDELGLSVARRVCMEHPLKIWQGKRISTPFA